MGFCQPIGIARSAHSTALLKRAGIDCRWGDVANPEIATELLADCDLVFDLAFPSGKNIRETKRMLRARISSILLAVRPAKGFILASTTAVYRYNSSLPFFRAYRSMKLFAERLSRRLGSQNNVPVFIFRLGQVHGALQSCSESLKVNLSNHPGPIHVPDQASNAIFVFSIAEAIRSVLFARVAPKTYTMIASPAWSFADLVEWYSKPMGLNPTVIREAVTTNSSIGNRVASLRSWVGQGTSRLIDHNKELLSAIVSICSEARDQKFRFERTRKTAAVTINAHFDSLVYRPFEALNDPPGIRFPFHADLRTAMEKPERAVAELIQSLK
ncbi:MAG: hypothetical protein QOD75_873 [Blastocatellia bacterium]|nr:hypothetical protein [Blastocatellia bacterium]